MNKQEQEQEHERITYAMMDLYTDITKLIKNDPHNRDLKTALFNLSIASQTMIHGRETVEKMLNGEI